jgi:hypothetical protein
MLLPQGYKTSDIFRFSLRFMLIACAIESTLSSPLSCNMRVFYLPMACFFLLSTNVILALCCYQSEKQKMLFKTSTTTMKIKKMIPRSNTWDLIMEIFDQKKSAWRLKFLTNLMMWEMSWNRERILTKYRQEIQ